MKNKDNLGENLLLMNLHIKNGCRKFSKHGANGRRRKLAEPEMKEHS